MMFSLGKKEKEDEIEGSFLLWTLVNSKQYERAMYSKQKIKI